MTFFLLVDLMHEEANYVPLQAKLVKDDKLTHRQKKVYKKCQGVIFKAWEKYQNGDISAKGLLNRVSFAYAPNIPNIPDIPQV